MMDASPDLAPERALASVGATTIEAPAPPPGRRFRRLHLLTLADCAAAPPRGYIVKGLIAPGDLVLLIGPPGAGKSVLAPYIAHAVAAGRGVFGRRVRGCPVLYVAAEDGEGMKHRGAALRAAYGDTGSLRVVADAFCLTSNGLEPPPDVDAIRQAARAIGAGLIVLDTFARAFPDLDENDGRSMGIAVRTLRQIGVPDPPDAPGRRWVGAAILAVHHGAKAGGETPRGHGNLNGDADVTMRIETAEATGVRTVRLGKNRNGTAVATLSFTIRAETLGTDDDGDPIAAPLAVEVEGEDGAPNTTDRKRKAEARLPDPQALLLRELRTLAVGATPVSPEPGMPPVPAVDRSRLRVVLVKRAWFTEAELRGSVSASGNASEPVTRPAQTREHKALQALQTKGFAGFNRTLAWPL